MRVLVDYDNITKLDRSRGLVVIVNKIFSSIPNLNLPIKANASVRLYGGWYNHGNITHKAQLLSAEIANNFPIVIPYPPTSSKIIVNVELAFSILIAPREHILETYRIRSYPTDLKCDDPRNHGCTTISCPINHIYKFINTGSCDNQCCTIRPNQILYKGEQKLVDSMINSDLFYLSMSNESPIILVSSDDDFWPGIRTALELSTRLIQLHTKNNYLLPKAYLQHTNHYYEQYPL